jgi:hypothetical protein
MEPDIILPLITDYVNQHYESWDNAHPNQMWTNAQKAIVNNYINNRINDLNQEYEDEILGIEEIQEMYNNLVDLLEGLFLQGNNNPANVYLFQNADLGLLGNDNNNNDDEEDDEEDDEGEHSPTSVADKRFRGGKKRKRKTIRKRKSIRRRKSRRRKSRRRK